MLSMLKMDIRKMFHSKSFYVSLVFFLLFSTYCIYTQAKWQVINNYSTSQNILNEAGLSSIVHYYLTTSAQFMYSFTLKSAFIIFGIFIITFVASDYQSGFIKNSCMMCKNRNYIIWNKFYIILILSVVIVLVSILLTTILGYILVDDFKIGDIYELLMFSGISILLYVSFFLAITFLYRLTKNKIPAIIVTLFIPLGLGLIFIEPIFKEFTKYTLNGIFINLPFNFHMEKDFYIIILLLFFIVLYQTLDILLFRKRDI